MSSAISFRVSRARTRRWLFSDRSSIARAALIRLCTLSRNQFPSSLNLPYPEQKYKTLQSLAHRQFFMLNTSTARAQRTQQMQHHNPRGPAQRRSESCCVHRGPVVCCIRYLCEIPAPTYRTTVGEVLCSSYPAGGFALRTRFARVRVCVSRTEKRPLCLGVYMCEYKIMSWHRSRSYTQKYAIDVCSVGL